VLARFEQRFGALPAEWHSGVSPPRRRQVWEAVASGNARIVVGARSALFLPFRKLRLVVVDEEHDSSFKQEEGFIYQARDLAVARAKIEGALVLLASATPSLESLFNAQAGRYRWLRLSARHGAAQLPDIDLIDMRQTPPEPGRWLSPPLVKAMAVTLQRGEQSHAVPEPPGLCAAGPVQGLRREDEVARHRQLAGRAPLHRTAGLPPDRLLDEEARGLPALRGQGQPGLDRPRRGAGRGGGAHLFPDARVAVFSSDTVMDADGARTLVETMAAGEIDILVATQAAAKGHNFPNLTLVGVVDADLSLRGGDLRAGERTFQLLAQAAGRAGRHEKPGRALLQTYSPEHAVMQALKAQDRDAFVEAEMGMRQDAGLPPFGRLAAVIASGPDAAALDAYVDALAAVIPNAEGVEVFGPADAPLALVRGRRPGRARKRFLVRADRTVDLQGFMAGLAGAGQGPQLGAGGDRRGPVRDVAIVA
jgi:primosomal protein N' (replication factor Y)